MGLHQDGRDRDGDGVHEPLRVLIVEDSTTDAKLIAHELRRTGRPVEMERVEEAESMRAALEKGGWDVVLCDWAMPRFTALAALALVKEMDEDLPFIIVSGMIGEEAAVGAMRAGAHDYVLKDRLGRLSPAVEREIRESKRREAGRRAEEALRQSESQLLHAQKMEAVGRLAGGVAHDFNNLLSVILSYGDLLLDDLDPDSPLRDDVVQIRNAGKRAAELTQQLLTFSRHQVLEPTVVDLNDVVAGMHKMLQRIVGEDVDLVSLPGPSLGRVIVDAGSIEQVIMNLVVNARDAMPSGGVLTMQTANVLLDEEHARAHLGATPGWHVMLAVDDTGTGMDAATQTHLFEPFFTTKGTGKGTGLGLSTVFGIVRRSGGSIWLRSAVGKGTTFRIYLPLVEGAPDLARPHAAVGTMRRGSETILLVEDEEHVRAVALEILRRHGYEVLEARGGAEALRVSEAHAGAIDLLLSDVVMPQMSGPELARRLCEARPETRVLCMSGYTDDSVVRHGLLEVDAAFLHKPIRAETLTRKVRDVLDEPPRGGWRPRPTS